MVTVVELNAVLAIWTREVKVYWREKERVISSFISPLLWLFVFGSGLGGSVAVAGGNYQHFIFPGIVIMSILFSSIFYGLYIIWDRKLDFLKEVLVAPASRSSVFLGKVLGGVTDSMFQALILLTIGAFFILPLSPLTFIASFLVLLLIVFSTTSLGLVIGSNMRSEEGFGLVMNFVIWPLFFFSGALFQVSNLPDILKAASSIDPITYAVDALRIVMLGTGSFPLYFDIAVLLGFAAVAAILGIISFGNLQQVK